MLKIITRMNLTSEIKSIIVQHFISKNYKVVSSIDHKGITGLFDLFFRDSEGLTAVKIIEEQSVSPVKMREKIENTVVKIISSISNLNISKVYLVIVRPRLSSLPSVRFFEEARIGLITVSSSGEIIERIPAKVRCRSVSMESNANELMLIVGDLRTKIYVLEERLKRNEELLKKLVKRVEELDRKILRINNISREESIGFEEKTTINETLEFLEDNPWLNVLSKRSRE